MKTAAQIVSWLALAATILAPMIYLAGTMTLPTMITCLNTATILWFIATPIWMERSEN
jgi:hypothetical protein